MSAATLPEITVSPEMREFLKRHNAEGAFAKVCELVRECYPDLRGMSFRLLDDPDTEDRHWLIIQIEIPTSLAGSESLRDRENEYHGRLVREVPLDMCPHFAVSYDFTEPL